ncbi:hypothetical protein ARMGADRAFT_1039591 [Armillaria gallica]|uniref:Uncharacterized protein n=1 Tax=Armillaria gallica TaxID=47427 RepID=A0A2H3CGX5_ARMGA|nr:hypothetical protein ARMGADRAFT_1039591 [Armillaria gallica]
MVTREPEEDACWSGLWPSYETENYHLSRRRGRITGKVKVMHIFKCHERQDLYMLVHSFPVKMKRWYLGSLPFPQDGDFTFVQSTVLILPATGSKRLPAVSSKVREEVRTMIRTTGYLFEPYGRIGIQKMKNDHPAGRSGEWPFSFASFEFISKTDPRMGSGATFQIVHPSLSPKDLTSQSVSVGDPMVRMSVQVGLFVLPSCWHDRLSQTRSLFTAAILNRISADFMGVAVHYIPLVAAKKSADHVFTNLAPSGKTRKGVSIKDPFFAVARRGRYENLPYINDKTKARCSPTIIYILFLLSTKRTCLHSDLNASWQSVK